MADGLALIEAWPVEIADAEPPAPQEAPAVVQVGSDLDPADRSGPVERRWRLLQMLVDEPGMGRVQIGAELEPLVEYLEPRRRAVAVALVLEALEWNGYVEHRGRLWYPTAAGRQIVRRRWADGEEA